MSSPALSLKIPEWAKARKLTVAYETGLGAAVIAKSEEVLTTAAGRALRGKVQLVLTSPPYPLNRKKA